MFSSRCEFTLWSSAFFRHVFFCLCTSVSTEQAASFLISAPKWRQRVSSNLSKILIFSSHLCLGLPNDLSPSGISTIITLYVRNLLKACYTIRPSHSPRFYHVTKSRFTNNEASRYINFLHSPISSSLLGPNISSALCSQASLIYLLTTT